MLILGIETSCDDTAAAVVSHGATVHASIVSSQNTIHAAYGGVVPELACRSHVENLQPVVCTALAQARVTLADIDTVAITQGPGLIGALLVGLSFAKALAYATHKPLVAVHHLEGHICSIFLEHPHIPFPFIALVVSGGHSDLYYCAAPGQFHILGRTRDDAAGECFDKVAKMLHLGYPGGPIIDRLAQQGNPRAVAFPRAMRTKDTYDFSFSGVKTAVRSHLLQVTAPNGRRVFSDDAFWPVPEAPWWVSQRNDILASFQQAVVDSLTQRTLRAVTDTEAQAVAVVGGVACNSALRQAMQAAGYASGIPVFFPSPHYCTDNAAMIACAGYQRYQREPSAYDWQNSLDLEAYADLPLVSLSSAL